MENAPYDALLSGDTCHAGTRRADEFHFGGIWHQAWQRKTWY